MTTDGSTNRPRIQHDRIAFRFVESGQTVHSLIAPVDELWLDVGNDLRTGVIDHHHLESDSACATGLVVERPEFVFGAVKPQRSAGDEFSIVLHQSPDLDGVASAFLATHLLHSGELPAGSQRLAHYVTQVEHGYPSMTLGNPFTLYAAFMHLVDRIHQRGGRSKNEQWKSSVHDGFRLIDFVLSESVASGKSFLDIDAFDCPELFSNDDRESLKNDISQYEKKLADPKTHARRGTLQLPLRQSGKQPVDTLLVRDVQSDNDPQRCRIFKVWARSDEKRAPDRQGFVALSVYQSQNEAAAARCIISVRPEDGVTLKGLADALDRAESIKRQERFGVDDRKVNPDDGQPLPPRPGYENADPWYDGRGHGFTIVDSPRSGTVLSADETERIFVEFGETDFSAFRPA